jgi:hypothetical protein
LYAEVPPEPALIYINGIAARTKHMLRAINTMEESNGQEWEIEQEGTPEQKDKEIDESRREEAA